jgi:hypothetical protein
MQFAQALERTCKALVHKHKRGGGAQLAGSGSVLLLTRVVKLVQALAVTVVHVVVLHDDGVLLGKKCTATTHGCADTSTPSTVLMDAAPKQRVYVANTVAQRKPIRGVASAISEVLTRGLQRRADDAQGEACATAAISPHPPPRPIPSPRAYRSSLEVGARDGQAVVLPRHLARGRWDGRAVHLTTPQEEPQEERKHRQFKVTRNMNHTHKCQPPHTIMPLA